MKKSFLTLCLRHSFAVLIFTSAQMSTAQTDSILVKTSGGCSIYINSATGKSRDPAASSEYMWTGECVDGFAQGPGNLQLIHRGSNFWGTTNIKAQLSAHRGRIFGFFKSSIDDDRPEAFSSKRTLSSYQGWIFLSGEEFVSFGGLGLDGDDSLLAHGANSMPTRKIRPIGMESQISIHVPKMGLMFLKSSCTREKPRAPDCGFGAGQSAYEIYGFVKFDSGNANTWISCPQRLDEASCGPLAALHSEPLVQAAEQFIRAGMPRVIETQREMQSVLAGLNASKAQAKIEVDNTNARFDASLNTVSVGELFALADEYKSKADLVRARTALRKLISRFPEHRLAKLSADMLIDMQGK